jgi:hypothetical protein
MKLFGFSTTDPDPVKQAQSEHDRAKEKRDQLAEQLGGAERGLVEAKQRAADAALDGTLDGLQDLSSDAAIAAATVDALGTAFSQAEAAVRGAQVKLAGELDRLERNKSIAAIETLQRDMAAPFEQLIAAIATLLPLAKQAAAYQLDMQQVAGLLEQWSVDASAACEISKAGLTHHAEGIRSGTVRARLPAPEEAKPRAMSAPPVTRAAVVKHDVRWSENGATRYCRAFWDAPLPPILFERAIAHNIAVDASSDEAMKLRRQRIATANAVDLDRCVNLDVDPPEMPPPRGDVWVNPHGVPKWQPPTSTNAPLSSWTGTSAWIKQSPTNSEGF